MSGDGPAGEIELLKTALAAAPDDAQLPYRLGNLLYEQGHPQEAIAWWEKAVRLDRKLAGAWRNLGVGYFNVLKDAAAARGAYERAFRANPEDARVLYERDQLWRLLGETPERRLEEIEAYRELPGESDELTLALCALLNGLGQHGRAMEALHGRDLVASEQAIEQTARTHVGVGRTLLWQGRPGEARNVFEEGLAAVAKLGGNEAALRQRELFYWAGMACRKLRDEAGAERNWTHATVEGEVGVEQVFAALALREMGKWEEARGIFEAMLARAQSVASEPAVAKPAMSLMVSPPFEADNAKERELSAKLLEALGRWGLGEKRAARVLLGDVLRDDPNCGIAANLKASLDWQD